MNSQAMILNFLSIWRPHAALTPGFQIKPHENALTGGWSREEAKDKAGIR